MDGAFAAFDLHGVQIHGTNLLLVPEHLDLVRELQVRRKDLGDTLDLCRYRYRESRFAGVGHVELLDHHIGRVEQQLGNLGDNNKDQKGDKDGQEDHGACNTGPDDLLASIEGCTVGLVGRVVLVLTEGLVVLDLAVLLVMAVRYAVVFGFALAIGQRVVFFCQ